MSEYSREPSIAIGDLVLLVASPSLLAGMASTVPLLFEWSGPAISFSSGRSTSSVVCTCPAAVMNEH